MNMIIKTLKNALVLSLLFGMIVQAQDDSTSTENPNIWTSKGSVSLSFANVGLENWSGGGDPSVSFGGILDASLIRETDITIWENSLNIAYGVARVGGPRQLFKKTDDQIIFKSNYNYRLDEKWSIAAFLDFRTQSQPGHNFEIDPTTNQERKTNTISNFMAPAYLLLGLGMEYRLDFFKVNLSPITNKTTFVLDDSLSAQGLFGVEAGENIRYEFGANLSAALDIPVMENVNFKTNLNLFYNYETPNFMDVNWETLLVLKVNEFIHTSFATQLIYDNDADILSSDGTTNSDAQFKHVLNINVGFTF